MSFQLHRSVASEDVSVGSSQDRSGSTGEMGEGEAEG
jgi:hypothetical protein